MTSYMSPEIQILMWGALTCVPVLLAYFLKSLHALGIATLLLMGWVAGRVASVFWAPPESMALYPLLDAAFGILIFSRWVQTGHLWKITLVALLAFQCTLHLSFWAAWFHDATIYRGVHDPEILYRYKVVNNCAYLLELLCCSWGALQGAARDRLDWLLGRLGGGHHARIDSP